MKKRYIGLFFLTYLYNFFFWVLKDDSGLEINNITLERALGGTVTFFLYSSIIPLLCCLWSLTTKKKENSAGMFYMFLAGLIICIVLTRPWIYLD